MDGTLGSQTAWMLDGSGVQITSGEELAEIVRAGAEAGWPVGVHAIGDRANREALDAFEATRDVWEPRGLRPRIEHAQCLAPEDVARFAQIGVAASVQFTHAPSDRDLAERFWPDQLDGPYAFRSLVDSGALVANGSDAPIEELDPWAGVVAASATRQRGGRGAAADARAGAPRDVRRAGVALARRARARNARPGPAGRPRRARPRPVRCERSSATCRSSRRWSPAGGCTTRRPGSTCAAGPSVDQIAHPSPSKEVAMAGDRRQGLRASPRALDRAAAGPVPVDHAHGACCRGRVLDLHLRAGRAAGAAARGPARAHRVPLRSDGDRTAREAVSVRGRPLRVRGPLARAVGRLPRRLVVRRLPAARRAVPLPRVRLGDERRGEHRGRLALHRPVVDLGAADGRDRVPADVPRHPPLDDGRRHPRRVRDRDLRRARALDALLERRRAEPAAVQPEPRASATGAASSRGWCSRSSRSSASRRRRRSARRRRTRGARSRAPSSARRS